MSERRGSPGPVGEGGMRRLLALGVLLAAACGAPEPAGAPAPVPSERIPPGLVELHEEVRVAGLESRSFDPGPYWAVLESVLEDAERLRVEPVGESAEGRPLRLVSFGTGPTSVLLWSQMHGDEPTASMALADLFAFVENRPEHPVARAILDRLTVHTIPVLNPDGAQRFQRRNAQGIDINRDARALATPEGQTLKRVFDRVRPAVAFNLHDQDPGTRVGSSERGVAIALLSPPFDETRAVNDVRDRAMRVAAVIRTAIEPMVGGHIARYDDTFNPRAFGDLTTAWGASTVLVESGGWRDDPEKQYLRAVNFVGLLAALHAIATDDLDAFDPALYRSLPQNGRRLPDLLVTGGTLAVPGLPPLRADLLIEYGDALRRTDGVIVDIGDLAERTAVDTIAVDGLYVVPHASALERAEGSQIQPGAPARFDVARTPDGPPLWRFEGGPPPE